MRKQPQFWLAVAAIGALLAGLAAVAALVIKEPHPGETRSIAVFDTAGAPAINLFLIFTDGERLDPTVDGVFQIPDARAGEEGSVRDLVTRRELCRFVVPRGGHEFQRLDLGRC
jgi:hypothetical protein